MLSRFSAWISSVIGAVDRAAGFRGDPRQGQQFGFRIAAEVLRPGDAVVAVQAIDLARRGRIGGIPGLVVRQTG